MPRFWNRFLQEMLIPLFPQRCVLCINELSSSHDFFVTDSHAPLCMSCGNSLKTLSGRRCRICSEPLVSEIDVCTACRGRTFVFDRNLSLFKYHEDIAELLWIYKFGKQSVLHHIFLYFFLEYGIDYGQYSAIVSVPPSPQNLRKRGFDQAAVIGKKLAQITGIPYRPVLERAKGISQKMLSQLKRQMNLQGLISVKKGSSFGIKPLLLDDIFTTGATANECARVLKDAGAETVHVLTIAKD